MPFKSKELHNAYHRRRYRDDPDDRQDHIDKAKRRQAQLIAAGLRRRTFPDGKRRWVPIEE